MTRKRFLAGCLVVALIAGLGWLGYTRSTDKGHTHHSPGSRAIPVLVHTVGTRDVPVTLNGVGTAQAYRKVTVRPQVGGKLLSVDFREGQHVDKGDVLAKIDPVTYKAKLEQARAQLAQDQAALANDQLTLKRDEKLVKGHYVSRQDVDLARANVRQDKARIQADRAGIDSASATLGYTTIKAPISGRTGLRLVDEGNIVSASGNDDIVVITQLHPISVVFTLPTEDLRKINRTRSGIVPAVTVLAQDGTKVLGTGQLQAINNEVNQSTGTVKLKAALPNKHDQLWPGQFVNVRLQVGMLKDATVVPMTAVQQGPNGAYVYRLGTDDKVIMQSVQVRLRSQTRAVIAQGVKPGDTVIVSGFSQLTDGASVKPEKEKDASGPDDTPHHE